ncbi:hypothetical protein GN244_ATG05975 [Phytophthora infestans]|uniref:Ty3 transposon capsid-like protein domain-containing protein n=1 Tax=Phytophthora infestans TaxID=4787 RepID=A0A833T8I7_PHYIN|nr:hypothetical protein GN244_ATG05975 [Phytophthora infestans]
MTRNPSPNPRPRQQRRTREEDTAADTDRQTRSRDQDPEDADPGAAAPHPVQQPAVDAMAMMRQMFEFMNTKTKSRCLKCSSSSEEMQAESSDFVDTIFGNLGPAAQTWYRDFKISLGDQPATWTIFKQQICERFREDDFQHKVLSRLHNLRWSGSQQAYSTKFLHLLSQLDCELPEVVKHWYYQQNLRSDTSAFVSQHVPSTLKEVIELAQRFEDSRATIPGPSVQKDQRGDKLQGKPVPQKKNPVVSYRGCLLQEEGGCQGVDFKKRLGSVGWHPAGPEQSVRGSRPRSDSPLPKQLQYHADDAVLSAKEKVYGYLSQRGRIADAAVAVFIDSGASFNAIDAKVASIFGLLIKASSKPLNVKLGSGQRVSIPRRTTRITTSMCGFPAYDSEVFVMDIPEELYVPVEPTLV